MAFMVEHTTGIICAAMRGKDLDRLELPLMVSAQENEEALSTAFTVTVDARHGTSTGVSATDRFTTISTLADPYSTAHSLRRPGHIFPLRYAMLLLERSLYSSRQAVGQCAGHFRDFAALHTCKR